MRGIGVVLCLMLGCGRIGFNAVDDTQPGSGDGGDLDGLIDDDAATAPPDALSPMGPFGMAMEMTGLNTGSEDDPALTGDQLEIFFDSGRAGGMGGGDIWTATRTAVGAPWTTPINVTALNGTGDDATPDVTADGLTIVFVTQRTGGLGAKDLYMATRVTRTSPWSALVHLAEVSGAGDESGPAIGADGRSLYFSTDLPGNETLYFSERAQPSGPWGTPQLVPGIDTTAFEGEPWIDGPQTFLVFSTTRTGSTGRDLWGARRASTTDPFGPPTRMTELATAGDETDPWLSPDQHVIVFARGSTLFMATR